MGWFTKDKEPDKALEDALRKAVAGDSGQKSRGSGSSQSTGSAHAPMQEGSAGSEQSIIEKRFGKLRSALGPGTEVQGRLSFDSAVSLDGVLKGTIRSTELIVVSKLGRVEATSLVAKALVIEGEVSGNEVTVSERLEVLPGGRFIGTASTPIIVVAEGGIFDGVCKMSSREEAASLVIPPLSSASPAAASASSTQSSAGQPSGAAPGKAGSGAQSASSSSAISATATSKSTAGTGATAAPYGTTPDHKHAKKKISVEELIGK